MSLNNLSARITESSGIHPSMLSSCYLVNIPGIVDARGKLSVLERGVDVSFPIQRVFYVYEVPSSASRARHALKTCDEFLIAIHGSFRVKVTDGQRSQTFVLDHPETGLHLPAMIWREFDEFSSGAICLVLASQHYDENDYIHDFGEFKAAIEGMPTPPRILSM